MAPDGNRSAALDDWILAVDDVAIGINVVGLLGNLAVFVTIVRGGFRSKKTAVMLGHQSLVDLLVCLVSTLKLLSHERLAWDAGSAGLNALICFVWADKLLYWDLVFASVFSLLLLSVDRYLTVVRPLCYRKVGHRAYLGAIGGIHCLAAAVNAPIMVDTVRVEAGQCRTGRDQFGRTLGIYRYGSPSFRVIGLLWLAFLYFLPMPVLIALYSATLRAFNRSAFARSGSEMRKKLSTQLTKSAAVVTGLYLFAFSIDSVYFTLAFFDVIVLDDLKNPVNRVASLFVNFHSITPFVYCLVLRLFRQRLIKTMTCGRVDRTPRTLTCRETTD